MIHIAIAEDDAAYAKELQSFIATFQKEYGQELHLTLYSDGQALLEDYQGQFDLLLLDIEMPRLDGMSTAQKIRLRDPEVLILFITAMPQYAIRGYEVDALDYILKPLAYFPFSQRLNRAISRLKSRAKNYLMLPIKGGSKKVDVENIYFVESQGHNLVFHTNERPIVVHGAMKEIEEKLVPMHFFRCNKGYLVSLAHVDSVQDGCAVVHGEKLLISRGRKNEFLMALANYMGGVTL